MEIDAFDPNDDVALARISPSYMFTARSAAYLNWRYVERPQLSYRLFVRREQGELVGYVVTKLFRSADIPVGDVVDAFFADPEVGSNLLAYAAHTLRSEGAHTVNTWAVPGSEAEAAAQSVGFERIGRPTHFGFRPLAGEALADLPRVGGWYLQKGDSDVY